MELACPTEIRQSPRKQLILYDNVCFNGTDLISHNMPQSSHAP